MPTARELMTGSAECIGENETLERAAQKMLQLDVGSLPICGDDQRLKGMVTDRDIVVKCLAAGGDLRTTLAGELGEGKPVPSGPTTAWTRRLGPCSSTRCAGSPSSTATG